MAKHPARLPEAGRNCNPSDLGLRGRARAPRLFWNPPVGDRV